jgi:hypothetical protein
MAGGGKGGGGGGMGGGGGPDFSGTDLSGPFPGSNSTDMFSGSMNQSADWSGAGGGGAPTAPDMVVGTVNDPTVQAPVATAGSQAQATPASSQGPGAGAPGAG